MPDAREILPQEVVKSLLKSGMILMKKDSPGGAGFRLKSHEKNPDAPLSPFYINLRALRSDLDAKKRVVMAYKHLLGPEANYDLLADLPTAATPLVSSLSDLLQVPMITPRGDKKSYGTGHAIDGKFTPGMRAAVIDDIITNGDSKIEFIQTLRDAGLIVEDVYVLIDREQGGREILEANDLKLHSFLTIREVLALGKLSGEISDEDSAASVQYLNHQRAPQPFVHLAQH